MEGFGILDQGCQAGARVVAGRLPIDDRRRIRLIAVTPRAPGSGSARRGFAMERKVIDRMMRREGIVVMLQFLASAARAWVIAAGVRPTCRATSTVPKPWDRNSADRRRRSDSRPSQS